MAKNDWLMSRRRFVKLAAVGAAWFSAANLGIPVSADRKDIVLYVDREGNAILKGAELQIDALGNAVVRKGCAE